MHTAIASATVSHGVVSWHSAKWATHALIFVTQVAAPASTLPTPEGISKVIFLLSRSTVLTQDDVKKMDYFRGGRGRSEARRGEKRQGPKRQRCVYPPVDRAVPADELGRLLARHPGVEPGLRGVDAGLEAQRGRPRGRPVGAQRLVDAPPSALPRVALGGGYRLGFLGVLDDAPHRAGEVHGDARPHALLRAGKEGIGLEWALRALTGRSTSTLG